MWRLSFFILFFVLLFPSQISYSLQNQIVFWNVGQGQWITAIDQDHCYHFDVGGEFINSKKVSIHCQKKENVIFYSHWDWDHIGLTHILKRHVRRICIAIPPQGLAKKYKKNLIDSIPLCKTTFKNIKKINFKPFNAKSDNDRSQIFIYNKKLLIPGDSTKKMEKIWVKIIPKSIEWLSVSHHGSRTSTSNEFLKHTKFRQSIISARKNVYGHPHSMVLLRLKKFGIATLRTEDWGNIKILTF